MKKLLLIFAVAMSATVAQAQVQTSSTSCYAYTNCYNGYGQVIGQASCQVYGSSYVYGYGSTGNSCQYRVIHGVGVRCEGYQQVTNAYGQTGWQWNSFQVLCP